MDNLDAKSVQSEEVPPQTELLDASPFVAYQSAESKTVLYGNTGFSIRFDLGDRENVVDGTFDLPQKEILVLIKIELLKTFLCLVQVCSKLTTSYKMKVY